MDYTVDIDKKRAEWKKYSDFKQRQKSFGRNKVYLFYGTQRGGEIILRFKSGDKMTHMDETVHFMDWRNALSEYQDIKSSKDMHDLLRRNN